MIKKKIKKTKLDAKISSVYLLFTFFFVVASILFLTSKVYMEDVVELKQTELNVVQDLNSKGEITINEWSYDQDKNLMQVSIQAKGVVSYGSKLIFNSISRSDMNRQLPVTVPYKEDEFYIVHINNVPKEFVQVSLILGLETTIDDEESEEKDGSNNKSELLVKLYTDERVIDRKPIETLSATQYAINLAVNMTDILENDIITIEESSAKLDKRIELLKTQIEDKEEDKVYQTAEEQLETSAIIHSLLQEIDELEAGKEINLEHITINEKKIEKLKQKRNDLELGG